MQKMQTGCLISAFDGEIHKLNQDKEWIVGREGEISIDEKIISRQHAAIFFKEESYYIKDKSSKNGTSLNGESLATEMDYKLSHGDTIEFSKYKYVFRIMDEETKPESRTGEFRFDESGGRHVVKLDCDTRDIVDYERKMLLHNDIKYLIRPAHMISGEKTSLYYEIEDMEQAVKSQRLRENPKEALQFLYQICMGIKSLQGYLLKESSLILDIDFVFVGKELMPHLIYRPTHGPGKKSPIAGLSHLARALVPEDKSLAAEIAEASSLRAVREIISMHLHACYEKEKPLEEQNGGQQKKEGSKSINSTKITIGLPKCKSHPQKLWLIGLQVLVAFMAITVKALHLLKTTDYIGFLILALALDFWVISTFGRGENAKSHNEKKRASERI